MRCDRDMHVQLRHSDMHGHPPPRLTADTRDRPLNRFRVQRPHMHTCLTAGCRGKWSKQKAKAHLAAGASCRMKSAAAAPQLPPSFDGQNHEPAAGLRRENSGTCTEGSEAVRLTPGWGQKPCLSRCRRLKEQQGGRQQGKREMRADASGEVRESVGLPHCEAAPCPGRRTPPPFLRLVKRT